MITTTTGMEECESSTSDWAQRPGQAERTLIRMSSRMEDIIRSPQRLLEEEKCKQLPGGRGAATFSERKGGMGH